MRLFNVECEKLLKAGFTQQLLHGGDAEELLFIGVKACALNGCGDCGFAGVFTVGAALDQFPSGERRAADCLLERVFLHIRCPGGKRINLVQDAGNFLIGQERRLFKVIPGKREIRFGSFPAFGLCLAEPAPFAAVKIAAALVCQFRLIDQVVLCPFEKLVLFHDADADIGFPGLVDGHADGINVVDAVKDLQSAQGIQHHLRIIHSTDLHAFTVLIVHDVQYAVRDNDAVGGAEAVLYPAGEIHSLLDQDDRVGAGLLCGLQKLRYIGGIPGGAVLHLLVVPGEIFDGIVRRNPQSLLQPELTECVGVRPFGGVVAALVLVGLAQSCGWRTVEPPFGRRSG